MVISILTEEEKSSIRRHFTYVDGKLYRNNEELNYVRPRAKLNGRSVPFSTIIRVLTEEEGVVEGEAAVWSVAQQSKLQRQMDSNRIERAIVRKEVRELNASNDLFSDLITLIGEHPSQLPCLPIEKEGGTLILQLSDLHAGETVVLPNNVFNMDVLSKRLFKYVGQAIKFGLRHQVRRVVVALTGDLCNSDRRVGERDAYEYNRTYAVSSVFQIIAAAIERISSYIPVTHVISVAGNESRFDKDLELSHRNYSNNLDWVVDRMLEAYFAPAIKFGVFAAPVERLITIDGVRCLFSHGISHAKDSPEKQLDYYRKKYAQVDMVFVGHLHSSLIAAGFSRSSSPVGQNDYSEFTLGIAKSIPSQTFTLIEDGTAYPFAIDLSVTGEDKFMFAPIPSTEVLTKYEEEI